MLAFDLASVTEVRESLTFFPLVELLICGRWRGFFLKAELGLACVSATGVDLQI